MSDGTGAERTSLRTGMGFAASSFVANVVVQLLSSVLTARLYGIDTIGEYALVIAPWLTLVQFSTVSEQIALVRELSVLPARDARVGRLFLAVLSFSVLLTTAVAAIVMLLSAAALRGPIDQAALVAPALVVLIGYVVFENTSWNLDSVFSAFRAGRELFFARLSQVLVFLVLAVALWFVSDSVWSLVVATVASFAVALVVRLSMIRRYVAAVPRHEVRTGFRELPSLLRFAMRLVPGSIANGLSSQAATWLLGAMTNIVVVGAYSRAAGVALRIQDAGHRLSEMVFPSMVERQHHGDDAGMGADLNLSVRGAAVPLFLISSVGGGVATSALQIFGEGFDAAADAFALLLAAYSLGVLSLMFGNAMLAEGKPWLATMLVIGRAVVIVGLMVPAIAWRDATGAAAAFCAGYVVDLVARIWLARRSRAGNAIGPVVRTLSATAAASTVAFVAARVLDRTLASPAGLVLGSAVGAGLFVGVVLALGGLRADELARVRGRLRSLGSPRRRR